jgi:uncharacterized protein GlcG (DUF336 family)/mannose-6-phosphate isomerase-like protein (cupin superfamily)
MKNLILSVNLLVLSGVLCSATFADTATATKKTLTLNGAERVIAAAKVQAQKLNAPGGVIAVVDDGGNLMALERLDGTFAAGANVSIGKARTAVQFKKPTRFFEELVNSSGKGRTVMTALNDFTPLIGGIPIMAGNEIVGGVGVSGAATADQDEQLAIAGANALMSESMTQNGTKNAMGAEVLYFEKNKVDKSFGEGAVLVDGSGDRNYMVHTSRREKPGQAEVHTKEADLIYVVEGSAKFVTGGDVVGGMPTAPDEIRGESINNGQTRQIARGDVVVVPNGVPHQFLEVTNPFLYYVVKVR